MSAKKIPSIRMSVTVQASREEVFLALSKASRISKWSGQKGKVEQTIGGKFELFDGWVTGKVLAFEKGKRLSYTWHPSDWPKDARPSIVTYKLASTKSGTTIALTHSGFPNSKEMRSHKSGWTEHFFEPIKDYLEATR